MAPKKKKTLSQKDFSTTKLSNEGVKIPLLLPDGTATEHWMLLLSTDSKHFKTGAVANNQKYVKLAGRATTDERKVEIREAKNIELISLLVKSWSFNDTCTFEEVVEFLTDCPAIVAQIDQFTNQRGNFFVKP